MGLTSPEEVFANALSSTPNLTHRVKDLTHSEPDLFVIHSTRDEYGHFICHLLDKPFIDELDELNAVATNMLVLLFESDWLLRVVQKRW